MVQTPRLTLREAHMVEMVLRNRPSVISWDFTTDSTLSDAYSTPTVIFNVPRQIGFRSPSIIQRAQGTTQYYNRGLTRFFFDPSDYTAGIAATAGFEVLASPIAPGDTITIGGTALTAAAGPRTPGADDFDGTLGTPALLAAEIEDAINDPVNSFVTIATATSAGPDVTLVSVVPGFAGNAVTLATSSANIDISGATFSGGTVLPSDTQTSFIRVRERYINGLVTAYSPIFIVPSRGFFTNTRPKLTISGYAPNVTGDPDGSPPTDALHFVLPKFADYALIQNTGGATIYVGFAPGEGEMQIAANQNLYFNDASISQVFIRGGSSFNAFFGIVNAEMG